MKNLITNYAKIYSNGTYKRPAHIELIENKLIDVAFNGLKRLIVTLPPRHGKSELISKFFPAWYLLNFAHKRVILSCYESNFASFWCSRASEVYNYFSGIQTKIRRQDYFETYAGGSMTSTGVGGAITGKGADLFIIDDPVKNSEESLSETYKSKTMDWFNSTAYTRLEPDAAIIIIMTRWNLDDLVGKLLEENNENWEVINIPAIANDNDILGRLRGEALWSERFNIDRLETIKKQIGSYWFSALYQQTPIASDTQIIKEDWINYFNMNDIKFDFYIQSWDTAFQDKQTSDFSSGTTWGIKGDKFYLVDCINEKLEYPQLKYRIINYSNAYNPSYILIENKASGQSLLQDLRDTSIPVRPFDPSGSSKELRLHLTAPLFENGSVLINELCPHRKSIIEQLTQFPYGKHDDIVDSITQFLMHAKNHYRASKFTIL